MVRQVLQRSVSQNTIGSTSSEKEAERERTEPSRQRVSVVDSDFFNAGMGGLVVVNVVLLSVETDTRGPKEVFRRINEGFLLVYLFEIIQRFLTHGVNAMKDLLMTLDIVVVITAFVDRMASERGLARALPVFRLLRMFRLLRALGFFRNSRELHVLMSNGWKAMITLTWVMLILLVVLWATAACTKVVIGESAAWNGSLDPRVEHEPFSSFDSREYFGTVRKSTLTLLQLVTLSQWADAVARRVMRVYPVLFIFFVLFLFATTYGLIMCVVSIIVQEAIVASRRVAATMKDIEREERKTIGQRAMKFFAIVDVNGDGELSDSELAEALQTTDFEDVLRDLQVPVLDAESLVKLFDRDGDGAVNKEELVSGIIAMGEDIQAKDYMKLSLWVWKLMKRAQALEGRLDELQEQLRRLRATLEVGFSAMHHFMNTNEDTNLRHRAIKTLRAAPPELPMAPAIREIPAPAPDVLAPESPPQPEEPGFAQLDMPYFSSKVALVMRRPPHGRWVTVGSPFVTVRDRPHIMGNHIMALRPGDLVEFADVDGCPVRPEHLPQHQFFRIWKVDANGKRGESGYVNGYTPKHGHLFAPVLKEDPQKVLNREEEEESLGVVGPVTVATPPRRPSPPGLPQAPSPAHAPGPSQEEVDKYGLVGASTSPNLLQLKELLA